MKMRHDFFVRHLKLLNLLPLCFFALMYSQTGTVLHRAPLFLVAALGVMSGFVSRNMKEHIISSLMLLLACAIGMIGFTYYYYYFILAADDAPIIGAFVVFVYGIFVMTGFAIGAVIVVVKDRIRKKKENTEAV